MSADAVKGLQSLYRQALVERLAALANARAGLGSDPAAAAASLRGLAHALRGSGATYGFPDITAAAAAVEDASPEVLARRADELIAVVQATIGEQHARGRA